MCIRDSLRTVLKYAAPAWWASPVGHQQASCDATYYLPTKIDYFGKHIYLVDGIISYIGFGSS